MRSTLRLASVLLLSAVVAACATPIPFRSSTVVPGAIGTVKVKPGDSGNTWVSLEVEHLIPASKLTPSKSHYVVWADSGSGGREVLLGLLTPDENLEAKLEGPVPFRIFRLMVTSEDMLAPTYPSSEMVLVTDYIRN